MLPALERFRKRKIVEWTLAYLASAWLLMQLVDVLSDRWAVPIGVQRGIDLLLIVGLFVTLTLAWYHGEKGRQRVTGPELLILAVLLFIAGALLAYLRPDDSATGADDRAAADMQLALDAGPGIAVLPFRNLSGNRKQEYFVAGMHESLISSLSQIRGLRVISRTSVMRYTDTDLSVPDIARELNVDSLIEGSVSTIGEQVRITVQLIDGQKDSHIWGDEYDRELKDVLILFSQVAETIAEQVEVSLVPEVSELLRSANPVDPELHDLYMRGRYAFGTLSPSGIAKSVEYFKQAITVDPEYAPAWAGLSGAHVLAGYLGYVSASEAMEEAERTSLRALALDPKLSIAHTSLGWVRLFQFEWDAARTIFKRALKLNPNDVDALHGLGDYLTITGNADAGMAYVRQARNNDPFSPVWGHSVVVHLHMMRRFEEAIAEADNILGVYPSQSVWAARGNACWELGRYDEALDNFRTIMAGRPERLDALESGYASDGPSGAARALADLRASTAHKGGTGTLSLALWYARAEDPDKTLEWLERAYELRAPDLIYIGVRPELEFLHGDKRFEAILARLKLAAL